MKYIFLILLLTTSFLTTTSYAHPGGHGDIALNEAQAISVAYSVIKQFITHDPGLGFGKLDNSWNNLPQAAKFIHKKHHDYYIIGFSNKNRTLFVLISTSGDVYDANFTGHFEGLK